MIQKASSFCESMYLSYFRFQSNAWQDEGVIFFLSQLSQWRRCEFFLFIFCKKKQVLLKSKSLSLKTIRVLQRICAWHLTKVWFFFHRFKMMWKEWESIAGNLSDWRRANTRNVSFFTLYGGQFTFSTQFLTLNYLFLNLSSVFKAP